MPIPMLSSLFRRDLARPTLKQRAAELRGGLARVPRPETPHAPLPVSGSPEAVAAYEAATREFTRLTPLDEARYAALRIGDTFTLWTTEWVQAAQRGDFTRFLPREMEAARSKTPAELSDLLVLTTRRDFQFAEAERRTNLRTLYALAYPEGDNPAPEPGPEGDHVYVVIAEHRAAYDAWKPLSDAVNDAVGVEEFDAAERAGAEPHRIQAEAFGKLIDARASTLSGLRALAAYLPGAVFDANCVEVEEDARRALRTMCNSVLALVPGEAVVPPSAPVVLDADAALLALGRQLDTAHTAWRAAEAASPTKGTFDEDPVERSAFEAIGLCCEAIAKHPASTVTGLAVRARAALHMTWPAGDYDDLLKSEDEREADYLDVLKLIGACCAAAGVNTHGDPIDRSADVDLGNGGVVDPSTPYGLATAIMDGWKAWHATQETSEGDPEAVAAYERAYERRAELIDAAEALPATPENLLAKALALVWLEAMDYRHDIPREERVFPGRLVFDVEKVVLTMAET